MLNRIRNFYQHRLAPWYSSPRVQHLLGLGLIALFTLFYILLVLHRYWQFEYFFVDNVYFHTALVKLAHFQTPIVRHPILGDLNIFGDHFHPTILIVAALYRLFPWHETILVSMVVAYGLSAVFAMLIGFKLLKSRALTYILLISYFLYLGTQNAMIFGFHEINLLPLFFLITVYGFFIEKRWVYWLGLGLLLLTKESLGVVGVALSIFIVMSYPKRWRLALLTAVVSISYYILATRYIIPYFSGGRFLYGTIDIPQTLPTLMDRLLQPPEKIETFLVSVATFGFLPLLNAATFPFIAQDFILRYIFSIPGNVQYTLSYHYGVALAPFLFFSSVWSLRTIENLSRKRLIGWFFGGLTLASTLFFHRLYHMKGPLTLVLIPEFYRITQHNAYVWRLVDATPREGKVMAQNHLGTALSDRNLYRLADKRETLESIWPDYIVYDSRDGQNPTNFFPTNRDDFLKLVSDLQNEGLYAEHFKDGELLILKKTDQAPPGPLH